MGKEWAPAERDAVCPVPLEQLGEWRSADPRDVAEAVGVMSEETRVRLALYCYAKSHLRTLGLTVAATIAPARLAELAGPMGEVLAAQARTSGLTFGIVAEPTDAKPAKPKAKVSLAGKF